MEKREKRRFRRSREYSNSLWHADWYQIRDRRWKGCWLLAYEDDASRFIVGFGIQMTPPNSEYSATVLKRAMNLHGKPASVISNQDSVFNAMESLNRERGLTEFERFVLQNKIRLIVGPFSCSPKNGKIGRFFSLFNNKIEHFSSISGFVTWYNNLRPHGSLRLETPVRVYHRKMAENDFYTYPSFLESGRETLA